VNISIVDFGMGNIASVYKKLSLLQVTPVIATTQADILKSDKLIVPGVGSFQKAMNNLQLLGLDDALHEAVLVKKVPVLGICLGLQLMTNESEEGDLRGLGWIDTKVVKFNLQDTTRYKAPQIGWNTIDICKESLLLKNIENGSEFYFLHSYHCAAVDEASILAKTEYEYPFVSAVEKGNIFGTQFHPEKSHHSGSLLLKNFIDL
jgi:glutamine amidotransferase